MPSSAREVRSRNDAFQQWDTLLKNRTKRRRSGSMIVQGVRPISMAVAAGWRIEAFLVAADRRRLSRWAQDLLEEHPQSLRYDVEPALLDELSEREETGTELLALVQIRTANAADLVSSLSGTLVALDRPGSPGNLGSIIRSADAFGAGGVIIVGHACDPFDPHSVRASTGSIFSVPIAEVPSIAELQAAHVTARRRIIAAHEHGAIADEMDLAGRMTLLFGNETRGLSRAVLSACDEIAAIPMMGTASSLNLAASVGVLLYESARQQRHA